MTDISSNPLLTSVHHLLDYAAVKPKHVVPAIEKLIAQSRAAIDAAADPSLPATWEAVITPLDDATEPLWRAWSVVGHLKSVMNTPELREAYNQMLGPISELATWIGLHEGLFKQYKRLAQAPDFAQWPDVRKRVIELAIRDFQLSGVELEGNARTRFAELSERQSQVSQKFAENVLDANDAWSLVLDNVAELDGVPGDVIAAFKLCRAATRDSHGRHARASLAILA
jgi:oligopeptidase A